MHAARDRARFGSGRPAADRAPCPGPFGRAELGHETHEREACLRLGLGDPDIDRFLPTPLTGAYVDVLAHCAEVDPVAFLLCITFAEGLPGTVKRLPSQLEAALGEAPGALDGHAVLDASLDHGQMARRLATLAGHVDALEGAQAMERFHDVLGLSQAAWRQVASAAAAQLTLKAPFQTSFRDLCAALAEARPPSMVDAPAARRAAEVARSSAVQ
jgi:hypothetical protein